MASKVLNSALTARTIAACKSRTTLRKSKLPYLLLTKRKLCSSKNPEDPPEKSKIEDFLNSSSPLRSSNVDDFWASSPYPEGTVFRDLEQETDSDKNEESATKSVILFPGQGNQFVGMAKNLMKYPVALDMFKTANDILGYNLLKICLEGPEHVLNDTEHCQPATFVCSLALLEKLKEERPWAISNCQATCGYSLGELTALVFAGVMNFEQGLNLVKVRAEAMAKCCKMVPGGMLTIFTGAQATLAEALTNATEHCKSLGIENPQCVVASYLFPNCKVIAGNKEGLDFIKQNGRKYGIIRHSMLPVSGAFHTLLMKAAEEPFKEKLKKIDLRRPIIKVYSNVNAQHYRNPGHILSLLPKQIYKPVKWEQTMHTVLSPKASLIPYVYECGPGNSLAAVATKVNKQEVSFTFEGLVRSCSNLKLPVKIPKFPGQDRNKQGTQDWWETH